MACPSKRQAKKRSKADRPCSDAPLAKTSKPDFTAGTEAEKFAGILNLASQLKEAADAIGCPLLVLGCLPQQATGLPLESAMLHSTCRIKNCEAPHLFSWYASLLCLSIVAMSACLLVYPSVRLGSLSLRPGLVTVSCRRRNWIKNLGLHSDRMNAVICFYMAL
eukprot:TRINITY_DN12639_c0_g2_i2.p3 TRINITY_DN12639_c0_g2~~TRINITY_DN12639_c0_g2_i2.p3  ORF type:complete len:164 (+),score=13.87 TRINITY_DN12639_c0_g2_i2:661-1152(+)